MVEGRILAEGELPSQMISRVVEEIASPEKDLGHTPAETQAFADDLLLQLDQKRCILSTPILTNAGRYPDRPLSACTIPPVDLQGDFTQVRKLVDTFHQHGMGTGFNLSEVEDPVSVLKYLNQVAVEGAASGREDRPVGNMGVLSVYHPKVLEFIEVKSGDNRDERWIFNTSIDVSEEFMRAVITDQSYQLDNGIMVSARKIFENICTSAFDCGDPGLVSIDRMNLDNPVPFLGQYVATAPCAEVGLVPGESCQFGYINLAAFYENGEIDLPQLRYSTEVMVRALDNALELSIPRYAHQQNSSMMSAKRKIGVGVCGLADLLVKMDLPYSSPEARTLALDLVTFINYYSKVASSDLARTRGSFTAMHTVLGNRYYESPGFIENKYGDLETQFITKSDWKLLGETIRQTGLLRNVSTIALPPTGRSGLLIDASTGVEPHFSLVQPSGSLYESFVRTLREYDLHQEDIVEHVLNTGSVHDMKSIPEHVKALYQTALDISPHDHVLMVASLQRGVDEAISKTINLAANSTPEDVKDIYLQAYRLGLKGIAIFRADSRSYQPRTLRA